MILVFWICLIVCNFGVITAQGIFASCVHGGINYKDGDYFLPNGTFIEIKNSLQCVQCRCNRGLVICEIEDCQILKCNNPIKYSQFCCLRCPEIQKELENPSSFVFGQIIEKGSIIKHSEDCYSNGRNYAHGSEWQPVIGPLGAMACVRCECRKGNIICTRLKCDHQPSCSNPIREFGECCPTCPILAAGEKEKKENDSKVLCLPKSSEIFVFKTPNERNDFEKIQYAFLDNSTENNVTAVYTWKLNAQNPQNTLLVKVSSESAWITWNFTLLGSTSKKKFKRFQQRGEKLKTKCLVQLAQCLKKLKRLENLLELNRVTLKRKCNQDEMSVTNLKFSNLKSSSNAIS